MYFLTLVAGTLGPILFYPTWIVWSFLMSPAMIYFSVFEAPFTRMLVLWRIWVHGTLLLLKICCGISYRIEGIENLREKSLYICNHQSIWETLVVGALVPNIVGVAKIEL